jgi:peptidyl-prolyl cis-trans isomerase C
MHTSPVEIDALRTALLQRARELGVLTESATPSDDEIDGLLDVLLAREARVPAPTSEECRRYYDANPSRFTAGEIVEASHILVAVTAGCDVEALRRQAETLLHPVRADASRFAETAARFSNCPSGAQGGNLGQLQRGETVPEFEKALFGTEDTGVLPRLVNTRHGFHIVHIERRLPGRRIAFEAALAKIADYLSERVRAKAIEQYIRMLATAYDAPPAAASRASAA